MLGVPGKVVLKNGQRVLVDDLKTLGDPVLDQLDLVRVGLDECRDKLGLAKAATGSNDYGFETPDYCI